jgi:hypothetical protein
VATTDLCTVQEVRDFLQKPDGDTGQDLIIGLLVTRASLEVMRVTGREFAPAVSSTARTFEYEGGGFLDLAPYDARTVTQVRIDVDEGSPTTLQSDEWRLFPYPSRDGVYTALRLAPYVIRSRARWQQRLVEVTGTWGFASVPQDVKHWTIVSVAEWLRKDVAAFSRVFNLETEQIDLPESLPRAAVVGLSRWRRESYR